MDDEYTREDLHEDMEFLRRAGLIEITGINEDGQWLWKATDASLKMSNEERLSAILMEEERRANNE